MYAAGENFNAMEDAQGIRDAMKGVGTCESTLINIICFRSNEQRQQIAKEYKILFGKDLISGIKSETSANFQRVLVALMTPKLTYYVEQLKKATKGLSTDEDALIEILCGMPPEGIKIINREYKRMYKTTLEEDIVSDTSGHFQRVLVSICTGGRDSSTVTDAAVARDDARVLFEAGEKKWGTDEEKFNSVMCKRSFEHIKLLNEEYRKLSGHSLAKAIESEFSGDIKEALLAILQCAINKHEYFASRLQKAMKGLGTNDSQLIRILVARSEIDLNEICNAFEYKYQKSLKSWIMGDTSGDYQKALLALIGEVAD